MTPRQRARTVANWINLTTCCGLLVARVGGARLSRRADGVLLGEGYRLRVPGAPCFTVGNVVLTRHAAGWLGDRPALYAHEIRHSTQYAWLGPLFFPLYALSAGWSWLVTGEPGNRNLFERLAGLADGGYTWQPRRAVFTPRRRHRAGAAEADVGATGMDGPAQQDIEVPGHDGPAQ